MQWYHSKSLDLSNNSIKFIPPAIGLIQTLVSLNLGDNQIANVPQNSNLSRLSPTIILTDTLIRIATTTYIHIYIITKVGDLINLEELDLHQNQPITQLPDTLTNLVRLKKLYIGNTHIETLPLGLSNLAHLIELSLKQVPGILEIPSDVGSLANLRVLEAQGCSIRMLADDMGRLGNLVRLDLRKNRLTSFAIPYSVVEWKSLTQLYLGNNAFEIIPDEFCQLVSLVELEMGYNMVVGLPKSIGKLVNLTKLVLNNNKIESLIPEIRLEIKPLLFASLNVSNLYDTTNHIYTYPLSICVSRCLFFCLLPATFRLSLICGGNTLLTDVSYSQLKSLQVLELRYNVLSRLPQEIGELSSLVKLDVSHNQLIDLPNELYLLEGVTMDLKGNNFEAALQEQILKGQENLMKHLKKRA
eukprot:jgi/Hompol1/1293/HPOL_005549-RA